MDMDEGCFMEKKAWSKAEAWKGLVQVDIPGENSQQ